MAEARPLDLGLDRSVVTPITGRFMPDVANPGGSAVPAEIPTQPRSAGVIAPPQGPSVALDEATAVKDIIDAVPRVEGSAPRFVGPKPNIRAVEDTVEGDQGQGFPVDPPSPGLAQRLLARIRGNRNST